ncbi:hypothetical protein ACE38V_17375 [Cytobacillus sp. Hz8]|uniref:hypothetical protein n=1 Tax=Cytobacillus sp. Hz8 TaxID=3347168 RepID=UPI0035DCF853
MIVGAVTVIVWSNLTKAEIIPFELYEIVPGFIVNLVVSFMASNMTFQHNYKIEEEFNESVKLLKAEK